MGLDLSTIVVPRDSLIHLLHHLTLWKFAESGPFWSTAPLGRFGLAGRVTIVVHICLIVPVVNGTLDWGFDRWLRLKGRGLDRGMRLKGHHLTSQWVISIWIILMILVDALWLSNGLKLWLAIGWSTSRCHIYPAWSRGLALIYRLVKKEGCVGLSPHHPRSFLFVADVGVVEKHLLVW